MIKHFLVTIDDHSNESNDYTPAKLASIILEILNDPHWIINALSVEPLDIVDHNKYPSTLCECSNHQSGYTWTPNDLPHCNKCGKLASPPTNTTNNNQ